MVRCVMNDLLGPPEWGARPCTWSSNQSRTWFHKLVIFARDQLSAGLTTVDHAIPSGAARKYVIHGADEMNAASTADEARQPGFASTPHEP